MARAGDEIWYTAGDGPGAPFSLHAVSLGGRDRLLTRFPSFARLHDISQAGRVLLTLADFRHGIAGVAPGETRERDLSWFDYSVAADLSADGKMLLFNEGLGASAAVYIRKTDGSSLPIRLGEGAALKLSRDLKWAVAIRGRNPSELVLLPTRSGEPKVLKSEGIRHYWASFFPDGARVFFDGAEQGHPPRTYVQDIAAGGPRPITPEGVQGSLTPDGRFVLANDPEKYLLYPVEGGDPRPLPGPPETNPGSWAADGLSMYVWERRGQTIKVFKRDFTTGRREAWMEITPADPTGIMDLYPIIAAEGKAYVYSYHRSLNNLYLVDGLK